MNDHTHKFFLDEVRQLLESHPVEELKPVLLFVAEDGVPTMLHHSGNKAVGNLLGLLEAEYGLGESSPTPDGYEGTVEPVGYVCLKPSGCDYHGPCCGCGRCDLNGYACVIALLNVFTGEVEAYAYGPSEEVAVAAARSRATAEGWQIVEGSDPSPLELIGMDECEMGDIVHDLVSLTGTAINNAGREAQVRYILGIGEESR
jgi:hypothetical protein